MSDQVYYTIYQITNLINGKIYVGAHKTDNLSDNYFGSGKHLIEAIKYYGKNNFKKDILYIFDTSDEMYCKELEIVNEEFVLREDTYNLTLGGGGGWFHIDRSCPDRRKKISDSVTKAYQNPEVKEKHSLAQKKKWDNPLYREKMSKNSKEMWKDPNHKEKVSKSLSKTLQQPDMKEKFSEVNKKKWQNPEYAAKLNNRRWVHDPVNNKKAKINKESSLPDGWKEGKGPNYVGVKGTEAGEKL